MVQSIRWTSSDLEVMPFEDGSRYEIIDGELCVSKQPSWHHQQVCTQISGLLNDWDLRTGAGETNNAPGVIFAEDDDVAPDVVWVSRERLPKILGDDGKLHGAPELIVEVLSPGATNERRHRQAKLKLYSRQDVKEYWIVDWLAPTIEVFRREGDTLRPAGTLSGDAVPESPLLPGFAAPLHRIFRSAP